MNWTPVITTLITTAGAVIIAVITEGKKRRTGEKRSLRSILSFGTGGFIIGLFISGLNIYMNAHTSSGEQTAFTSSKSQQIPDLVLQVAMWTAGFIVCAYVFRRSRERARARARNNGIPEGQIDK